MSWRKLGRSLGRVLNSVLVQRMHPIAGSPLPETSFSPQGASRIPGLSLSEFLFSFFPQSLGYDSEGDIKVIGEEAKRKGENKHRQEGSERKCSGRSVEGGGIRSWHSLGSEHFFLNGLVMN